ncbi:SIMPL domain-containing protein [Rhodohalobacter sp. 8-1]|uniref:SIMPL domain-containing protein n=1 Tax=Rhodohalobacter sp. 8-1 TaxID=3131972 RepID=UPI0030ECC07D
MRNSITSVFAMLLFLSSFLNVQAQMNTHSHSVEYNYITISSVGEAIVPADFAVLSINIGVSNPDAERAFELHKERESYLANLLSEMDLPDEKISYQPISIRPDRQRDGAVHTSTNQSIRLELDDFEQLSELQVQLISNEFDNFSGSLASSQIEAGNREALKQAVKNARADARLLAEAAGKELGDVLWIDHSSNRGYHPAASFETAQLRTADYGPSLGNFSQTITVQKNIQIRFLFADDDF